MISALNRLDNGNLELTITIPWKRVKTVYDLALDRLTKEATVKGFRKGKAPKKVVEQNIDKTTLYQEVLKDLVSQVYVEAIKEQNVKPVVSPQIELLQAQEGKDWQIKATTAELPEIKLGKYKEEIRKALAGDKIWVPGKDEKETKEDPQAAQGKKLEKAFQTLLTSIEFKLPAILVESEVNRMLSRLIDQTARLGMTVEQYLVSQGKTQEQIRAEYQQQAEQTLKLELILSAIADQEKTQVDKEKIEQMIKGAPDEATRKQLDTPEQRAYLTQLLRKQQVIDNLVSL